MQKETKKVLTLQAATYEKRLFWILCFVCPQICGFSEVSFILFSPEIKHEPVDRGRLPLLRRFTGQKERKMKNTHSQKTLFMVELALMVAIIFIMAFTPLGYFQTMGLSITFLTVPVAVGAIILGPKGGAICGLAFGITSFMQCFGMGAFGTMLFSINPLGTAITCIIPRVLEGLLCGLIFQALHKNMKNGAYLIASLACPLLNTLFFMSSLVVFFYNTDYIQGFVSTFGVTNPFAFVVAFVGVQGAIEAIVCFLLAGAISRALGTALHK